MKLFGYDDACENAGKKRVPWSHAWCTRKQEYISATHNALFLVVAIYPFPCSEINFWYPSNRCRVVENHTTTSPQATSRTYKYIGSQTE
jgi:hypothetical protein